ncbi:MAG: hypothetical protein E6R04_04920 [Spirochaetes bacterium]|nr:MAG: hypothetical protein E6R04_04920 [Spirochaetota bacterium]
MSKLSAENLEATLSNLSEKVPLTAGRLRGHISALEAELSEIYRRHSDTAELLAESRATPFSCQATQQCARGDRLEAELSETQISLTIALESGGEARAEAALYRGLLEVPMRKMVYTVRDYPGDKESASWLERAREALAGKETP